MADGIAGQNRPLPGETGLLRTVVLRPIATPLPIGTLALSVGSLVLAGRQLDWVPSTQAHAMALCLLAFVVPLQGISFIFGLLSRDESAASGLAVLSGCWLAIGLVKVTSVPGMRSGALGLLLVGAAVALLVPSAVAISAKPLMSAVFGLTALRFAVTGVYELAGGPGWRSAAGVIGLILSLLAAYAGCAFALEDARRREVLPIGRKNPRSSPEPGATADPVGPVTHEAGVRARL
jgi:succinate-acetate transporter protein